ncbi:hypothetical protein NDU88_000567 [Pleurodeles waltl]|uniref:Uncharacterized protein n=1 Tax=Pleurodeles waltl TaxID=8319 RepID=A0AAV7P432_PLEWA|nr:hypothetical protein NDU88_000567 [Pleurodeles waltl]
MDPSTSNPKEAPNPQDSKNKEKKEALSSPTRDQTEDTDKFGICCLCRSKCFKAWCKSVEYLQWTILVLCIIVICLILAIVLLDIYHGLHRYFSERRWDIERDKQGRKFVTTFVCPNRWLMYDSTCYYFSNENKTRELSNIFCSLHDALLAIILEPKDMLCLALEVKSTIDYELAVNMCRDYALVHS